MSDQASYDWVVADQPLQAGDEFYAGDGSWAVIDESMHGRPKPRQLSVRRKISAAGMAAAVPVEQVAIERQKVDEIAYRHLKPDELFEPGDEWLAETGRWIAYTSDFTGTPNAEFRRSRRPYNITQMQQQRTDVMRLNEDLNHEVQTLRPLVEGLERRCEQLQAALEAARKAPDFAEGVAEVLRRLEIAAEALDYLADVGTHDEVGYACGFGAAIAVVKKLNERPRGES